MRKPCAGGNLSSPCEMASLPSGGAAGLPTGLLRSAVDDDTLESMTQQLLQVSTVFLMQQNELQEVKERLQKELQRGLQLQRRLLPRRQMELRRKPKPTRRSPSQI